MGMIICVAAAHQPATRRRDGLCMTSSGHSSRNEPQHPPPRIEQVDRPCTGDEPASTWSSQVQVPRDEVQRDDRPRDRTGICVEMKKHSTSRPLAPDRTDGQGVRRATAGQASSTSRVDTTGRSPVLEYGGARSARQPPSRPLVTEANVGL